MIFCFFLLSLVFLQPLFENGFWTQYNRYFGTPKHLASEFHKSPDALNVKYTIKRGTEIIKGEGICIQASDAGIVLLEENGFHFLNKEKYTILEVIPEHIGKQLLFQTQSFIEISLDSLNNLVRNHSIKYLEVNANQNFKLLHNNVITITKSTKTDYPSELFFQKINEPISPSMSNFIFFQNPKIKTLQVQIKLLKKEAEQMEILIREKLKKLKDLKFQYHNEIVISKKEAIYQTIKEIEKVKIPEIDFSKIEDSQLRLQELKQSDYNNLIKEKSKLAIAENESLELLTSFTGTITFIVLI